jgi:hypothetical protein
MNNKKNEKDKSRSYMFEAMNNMFIILIRNLSRWLPLNHLMASVSIITIMSTCEANVKINDQQQHHKTYEAYKSAKTHQHGRSH